MHVQKSFEPWKEDTPLESVKGCLHTRQSINRDKKGQALRQLEEMAQTCVMIKKKNRIITTINKIWSALKASEGDERAMDKKEPRRNKKRMVKGAVHQNRSKGKKKYDQKTKW